MAVTILNPNTPIDSVDALNAALALAATQTSGDFEIDLAANANIALTSAFLAIDLPDGVTLTIAGNGATLNGQDGSGASLNQRGLFVASGNVAIADLTIANTVTTGGSGANGGGGGAGLGGGLFVGANGHVTLDAVDFTGNAAIGGNGGAGPGANTNFDVNSLTTDPLGQWILPPNPFAIATNLAFGYNFAALGGGDLYGRTAGIDAASTNTFSDPFYGAPADFGGGGQGNILGGNGGFGGGGGSGVSDLLFTGTVTVYGYPFSYAGLLTFGAGSGGYGAGAGSLAPVGTNSNGGGGGLGAGGAIFVQDGGSLSITGSSVGDGHIAGGLGANGAGNGFAEGNSIFIHGDSVLDLGNGQGVADVTTIVGSIAGERYYETRITDPLYLLLVAQGYPPGLLELFHFPTTTSLVEKGTLQIAGQGTVVLRAANQIHDIIVQSGTLELGLNASSAHADIELVGENVQLRLDEAVATGTSAAFASTLYDLSVGDRIDLRWLGYSAQVSAGVVGNVLSVSDGVTTETFTLGNAATFVATDDGLGGTLLTVDSANYLPFQPGPEVDLAGGEVRILGAGLQARQRTTVRGEIDDGWKFFIDANLPFYTVAEIRAKLSGVQGGAVTIQGDGTVALTANSYYVGATTVQSGTLQVDGSNLYSLITVQNGATLSGRGAAGPVMVAAGGKLAPGVGVGLINVDGLALTSGAILTAEVGGGISGADSDKVLVHGTVALNGATLDLSLLGGADLSNVSTITLIDNDGRFDPVGGTFAGLPEGASVTLGGRTYQIYYDGGDGNDVVLGQPRPGIYVESNETRVFGTGSTIGQLLTVNDVISDPTSQFISYVASYVAPENVYIPVRDFFPSGSVAIEGEGIVRLTETNLYTGSTTVRSGTLLIDGWNAYSPTVEVQAGATLGGQGRVSGIMVGAGGTLAPGDDGAGVLTASTISFQPGARFDIQIGGTTPGTGYDQLVTTAPVNGGTLPIGGTLNVTSLNGFKPAAGQVFTIIHNQASAFYTYDTFFDTAGNAIEDGSIVWVNGVALTINYHAQGGVYLNDVTLSAEATGPTAITIDHAAIDENAARGTAIGTLMTIDPDNAARTYALVPGFDAGGVFAIGGVLHDQIVLARGAKLDFEQTQSYTVRVEVTDGGGYSFTKDFTIAIGDVNPEHGVGNAADNIIYGGTGDDRLIGAGGGDYLVGGDGDDFLSGGSGADTLIGGRGSDFYVLDSANDLVIELPDAGTDKVRSSVLSLDLARYDNVENMQFTGTADLDGQGNGKANVMVGNTGANHLFGLDGDDRLVGRGGDDVLAGGAGQDFLIGGVGNDSFVFSGQDDSPAYGPDRIADFAIGDRIDVSTIDADGDSTNGITDFILDLLGDTSFARGHISQTLSGSSLILAFNTDHDAAAEVRMVLLNHSTPVTVSDLVF